MRLSWRRRVVAAAATAVVLAGPVLGAGRAGAATLSFTDAKGDATAVGALTSTPRPSDPELDLLDVRLDSSSDTLTVTVRLDKIGTPQASFGSTYVMGFSYGGVTGWSFRYQNPTSPSASASGLFFRQGSTTYPCGRCSAKLDVKAASLRITAPYASLSSAMRQHQKDIKPVTRGGVLGDLTATSLRSMSGASVEADFAAAKAGTTFTL